MTVPGWSRASAATHPSSGRHRGVVAWSRARWDVWFLVAIVLLSAIPPLVGVLVQPKYLVGDHSLIELGVRDVLDGSPPDVGVYSRYGWYHPGPTIYYLLAVPYLLFGRSSAALQIGALGISTASLLGVVLLLRRLRGLGVALAGLAICLLYLHLLPAGLRSDYWNPYLPLLPFLLACVLCWAAVDGLRWGFPAALVLLSACVQMHVGYLPGAVAVVAVTVPALLFTRRSRETRPGWWHGWAIAAVVLVLMWLPPLIQQLTGDPGNLGTLLTDLRRPPTTHPKPMDAWVVVATEIGRLPAFLAGTSPGPRFVLPPLLPTWAGRVAVGSLLAAALLAVRRRGARRDVVGLVGVVLAGTLVVASVVAFTRTRGLVFEYLVQWSTAAAILLWVAVAVAVARWLRGRVPRQWPVAVGVVLVVALVALSGTDVRPREPGHADVRALGRGSVAWVKAHGYHSVDLGFVPLARGRWLGQLEPGMGLCLEFQRAGLDVAPAGDLRFPTANVLPAPDEPAQASLLVAEVGNMAAVPDGYETVTQVGDVVVLGRALPS